MEVLTSIAEMKQWSGYRLSKGQSVGLVPTMGFLHEGHLSLMRRARSESRAVVVSIFVNPAQFGQNEDLSTYPRDPLSDTNKCAREGVDALFMPEPQDMYGPGYQTYVDVEKVSAPLCGAARPGHFRGVATVVLKLFNIVCPTTAYFGMKDYQQLQVIRTMVRDLNLDVLIQPCATVREADGLAMSSRNSYLSPQERAQAVCLYGALLEAQQLFASREKSAGRYIRAMSDRITREPDARPDYISLVHPDTLQDLTEVDSAALAVLAVRIGTTRLIDNMLLQAG
ncbi:MAG TPA: pantoate--beta-alanine ligase [Desulfomonilaceae bacterium]|nr:pantoate--beta-alanine ligase [Desulfomonilaceae bacterium]